MNGALVFKQHELLCELGEEDGRPTLEVCMLVDGVQPVRLFRGHVQANGAQEHLIRQIIECGDYQLGLSAPEQYVVDNPDTLAPQILPSAVFGMRTPLGYMGFGRICGNAEEDLSQFYQKVADGFASGKEPSELGDVIDVQTE